MIAQMELSLSGREIFFSRKLPNYLGDTDLVETTLVHGSRSLSLSIILPTYNESQNILKLLDLVRSYLPPDIRSEIIVVDDNSPDGTGRLVETYIQQRHNELAENCILKVVHRQEKKGLIPALLSGIREASGSNILIMDSDFSHPPELIPRFLNEMKIFPNSIIIGSRYTTGGLIKGWPLKRRIISRAAVKLAVYVLRLKDVRDPISGFFAFPKHLLDRFSIRSNGYKMLLEILIKCKSSDFVVREIPYTFVDREKGKSKTDFGVILDYIQEIWYLYRYGRKRERQIRRFKGGTRSSILFLSKAARFFTVGASGLVINYLVSLALSNGAISNLWYIHATTIGIAVSITTNFLLNKVWTFEDRDFSLAHTLKQYGSFVGISLLGAGVQLGLVYWLMESTDLGYPISLVSAVALASLSNFLLNKKLTFKEKIWG